MGRLPAPTASTPTLVGLGVALVALAALVVLPAGAAGTPARAGTNPFGVMLPARLARSPAGMELAKTLGVTYFRPSSLFLDREKATCRECDAARVAGLKLVLTVRASGPSATLPPPDLATFRGRVRRVLERYAPAVLVVENEESSRLFYAGTPEAYGAELKAACEVAHDRGIACANGGLVSTLVALLVEDSYRERGDVESARDFAARALSPQTRRRLRSAPARALVDKGKALIEAYRAAGADYANFHWYIADTKALREAVAFLEDATRLPVITNEIGQLTDDPRQTTAVMRTIVELGVPIAVWFGLDGPKARGLVDEDGSLRPTGRAFKRFIEGSR